MTLTIEQVRETRFRMARRNGYDPADVDTFVDKVETTLVVLSEENATMKQQVDTLSASGAGDAREAVALRDAEIERLKRDLLTARSGQSGDTVALQRQLDELRSQAQATQADLSRQLRVKDEDLGRKQNEIASLHHSLASGGGNTAHLEGEIRSRDEQLEQLRAQVEQLRGDLGSRDAQLQRVNVELNQLKLAPPSSFPVGSVGGGSQEIIVRAASDASPAVTRLLQMATEQAEQLVTEARNEADRTTSEATTYADRVTSEAKAVAERTTREARDLAQRIEGEARSKAERTTSDAADRAAEVDKHTVARRQELFSTLEQERNELAGRVDHLRDFEKRFRDSFTSHLERQISALRDNKMMPADTPDLLKEGIRGSSATPRLDALLSNDR